jgi:hypothetical protein
VVKLKQVKIRKIDNGFIVDGLDTEGANNDSIETFCKTFDEALKVAKKWFNSTIEEV